MSTPQPLLPDLRAGDIDPKTMPERCYTMLKSLNEFDKLEIAGVVRGLLAKTDRDNCFIGNYYRGKAHIETLLSLKSAKDLQAIAMVARGLFELAVDTKLIRCHPGRGEENSGVLGCGKTPRG